MQINDKVKDIIEKPEYRNDLDREFVDNILHDAYNENVWDEMVETLRYAGITLENIDRIFQECEEKRKRTEENKAREAGLNNK